MRQDRQKPLQSAERLLKQGKVAPALQLLEQLAAGSRGDLLTLNLGSRGRSAPAWANGVALPAYSLCDDLVASGLASDWPELPSLDAGAPSAGYRRTTPRRSRCARRRAACSR